MMTRYYKVDLSTGSEEAAPVLHVVGHYSVSHRSGQEHGGPGYVTKFTH